MKSVHFLVGRNVSGYHFPPSCLRAKRKKAEAMLKTALEALAGKSIFTVQLFTVVLTFLADFNKAN